MKDHIKNLIASGKSADEIADAVIAIISNMGMAGRIRVTAYKAGTKEVLRRSPWFKNLIVSSANYGRNIVAQRLGGMNTYTLNITHGEIGTGTTPPANSDTALTTPTVRGAMTQATILNNVVQLQFFFSDAALPNGTYNEFGCFIDGTSSVGSGKMFEHALFGTPYVKNTGEDTTVELDITITSL